MTKRALITGIGGQDGSWLAEQLLADGVEVHGLYRRSSVNNLRRIAHIRDRLILHAGDVTDRGSLDAVWDEPTHFGEVYHLADQDEVSHSFATPAVSVAVTYGGTVNVLEAVRQLDPTARVFVPSSATIFGNAPPPQNETTPLDPRSPYAVAKAAVLHACRMYREVHGLKVWCGIMFNHDSERRGGGYLLQEIARKALAVARGEAEFLTVGNPDLVVDVGHAADYMEVARMMLRTDTPDDYAVGTGLRRSVREIACTALFQAGVQSPKSGTLAYLVHTNPNFRRSEGTPALIANPGKAWGQRLYCRPPRDALRVVCSIVDTLKEKPCA